MNHYDWYQPHLDWLEGKPGGVRANLSGADLSEARLRGAISITSSRYQCRLISKEWLQYGCVCLRLSDWTDKKQARLCELHDIDAVTDLAECVRRAKELAQ